MNRANVAFVVVAVAAVCTSSRALADAAGDYQVLFGQEEKTAARTVKGSVEFAAKLATAAKSAGAQKDLQSLLCEKAYEYGMKGPAGYQAATDAMTVLVEAGGDSKAAAQDKLVKVAELRYAKAAKDERKQVGEELLATLIACGDDRAEAKQLVEAAAFYRRAQALAATVQPERAPQIADKIKGLTAAKEGERKIADLRARLEKDPKSTATRESLILACLGELDDPNAAGKLLTDDVSEGLRTYVPLAAKKLEELDEAVCLDLGEWYVATAGKPKDVSMAGKVVLLGKAQACCERYLGLHPTEDAGRVKAKVLLVKSAKALEAAGGAKEITLTLAEGVTMKLVRIPAGKFMMGSPDTETGRGKDEGPQHLVTIRKPFYMGVYQVTQAQWEAVMGDNPAGGSRAPDCPVNRVSWDDAVGFCKKLSEKVNKTIRLPTEAEWEYACRAGTKTAYFFGSDPDKLGDYAWCKKNADGKTHPVGQKKPIPAGLYDMYGNVTEWCSDWYADTYPKGEAVDPHGPGAGKERVIRGGFWGNGPGDCRSAARGRLNPGTRHDIYGFRVVVAVGGD